MTSRLSVCAVNVKANSYNEELLGKRFEGPLIRGLFYTFPNPVSNSLLVLYMIKPLLVYFIAKFNKVHWERVFYSKTVFTYRLLVDIFIFIWAQYIYDEARF